jgi:hypothetical protein
MTTEEKARELVNQFRRITDEKGLRAIKLEYAKKCALITVSEIIKSLRKDLPEIGLGKGYWYTVKKEIEKL